MCLSPGHGAHARTPRSRQIHGALLSGHWLLLCLVAVTQALLSHLAP